LKACRVPAIPTVGLYLSRSGTPNGDCGIVLERKCESSYDFALGSASEVAQRCHVAGPSVLAIPISSPGGQGERGACARHVVVNALAAASAQISRRMIIDRILDFDGALALAGPHHL
jgi:hypothetical protein